MTQKEKELLLKDLCARLAYGVKIQGIVYEDILDNDGEETGEVKEEIITFNLYIIGKDSIMCNGRWISLESCKPYLRPMSSMTEEEAREIAILYGIKNFLSIKITDKYIDFVVDDGFCSIETKTIWYDEIISSIEIFDWLNKKHFDYRGLIPKNLAVKVTEENNPYENQDNIS